MQHKTQEQLQRIAAVYPNEARPAMTRSERLERWAKLLDREPGRPLSTLSGTEYQPDDARDKMRSVGSPFSIAFEDPVLRAEGLVGDSYGDAKRFFELTDRQLHNIVCYCHHGTSMTAEVAARRVRAVIGGAVTPGRFGMLREAIIRGLRLSG
jgi:hypothetical protein